MVDQVDVPSTWPDLVVEMARLRHAHRRDDRKMTRKFTPYARACAWARERELVYGTMSKTRSA
jgi:hypothetical protein